MRECERGTCDAAPGRTMRGNAAVRIRIGVPRWAPEASVRRSEENGHLWLLHAPVLELFAEHGAELPLEVWGARMASSGFFSASMRSLNTTMRAMG